MLACGLVAVLFWSKDLPTDQLRPDLAPEQMVQLLAALHACAAALALRVAHDHHELLAAASVAPRRAGWLAVVLAATVASTWAATTAMDADAGRSYARNVALYLGTVLAVAALSEVVAFALPWLWFATAVTLGQASDHGAADPRWWAVPLHAATWHPEIAGVALLAGGATYLVRR